MKLGWLKDRLPVLATLAVLLTLTVASSFQFPGFASPRVFCNFLNDNAFLGVVAIGMTLVILTGGIDLSVGSVVGMTGVLLARAIGSWSVPVAVALPAVLVLGGAIGYMQGWLIERYRLAPFLVTLAGLFLCRGVALWVSRESIQVDDPALKALADLKLRLPEGASLSIGAGVFLLATVTFSLVLSRRSFGRNLMALGGNEASARLMGLPTSRTKTAVYTLSGLLASTGGVLFTVYTLSGNALAGSGLELDAIAAVVIGGTLLSGGYGSVVGTFLGVMVLAVIQTAIMFQGTLSSWWTKIMIGALLLVFLGLQRLIVGLGASGRLRGRVV